VPWLGYVVWGLGGALAGTAAALAPRGSPEPDGRMALLP
jgi:hypothetical protein